MTMLMMQTQSLFVLLLAIVSGSQAQQVYKYTICNGLSNQLLGHAASIGDAIRRGFDEVEIPDYFIVSGAQESNAPVLPAEENSVAFGTAFDAPYFLANVERLGIRARLVKFKDDSYPSCSFLETLVQADSELVRQVLYGFRLSSALQVVVDSIKSKLENEHGSSAVSYGVCLHHRGGQDWKDHCERWGNIGDGVYRGNCDLPKGETLLDSMKVRGLTDVEQLVYYCGDDGGIPDELKASKYSVVSRQLFLQNDIVHSTLNLNHGQEIRDLWALIDFSVCQGFPNFVGNSVSTFSALQIALRKGEGAYWYNSQSIPLAGVWKAFNIPIVYTYTELSEVTGKHLLQASIASVRNVMPYSKIHILYNGMSDLVFQTWLREHGVIIHAHDPSWRSAMEEMRQNGDEYASHLFTHSGNYFGTWQRIDIPLYIDSEYALVLDADTVVYKPFTMADFGLDVTRTFSMSSEIAITDEPFNAGVMLMNIPYMRKTYRDFLNFIISHLHSPTFDNGSPSDQGAYSEFYQDTVTFLSRCFNYKPYYSQLDIECDHPFIIHFHGAKPHDYLKHFMGGSCGSAFQFICNKALTMPSLCFTLQVFAKSSQAVETSAYCNEVFSSKRDALFCNSVMNTLVAKQDECVDMGDIIGDVLTSEIDQFNSRKDAIMRNLNEETTTMRMLVTKHSNAPSSAPSKACAKQNKKCSKTLKCCNAIPCTGKGAKATCCIPAGTVCVAKGQNQCCTKSKCIKVKLTKAQKRKNKKATGICCYAKGAVAKPVPRTLAQAKVYAGYCCSKRATVVSKVFTKKGKKKSQIIKVTCK